MEWQDVTADRYIINSLYWTMYRMELLWYAVHVDSCQYPEIFHAFQDDLQKKSKIDFSV